mgnify:FL=1
MCIRDSSGSNIGIAGTINFGDNLSVTPVSAGIVTITGSASGGSGISTIGGFVNIVDSLDVDGHTNLDNVSISGVVTATSFKGDGDFVELDVDGHTNLDNVNVAGVTTFAGTVNTAAISASGALTIADITSSGGGVLSLKGNGGGTTLAKFTNGGSAELNWNNTKRLETTTSGVTVTGTVAATAYTGDGSQLTGISAGSTSEVRSNTLAVSGVSTFSGEVILDTHPTRIKSTAGDLTIGVGNTSSFFITGGPYTSERFETTMDCVILYSAGAKAVSYTHLTLPTNREV